MASNVGPPVTVPPHITVKVVLVGSRLHINVAGSKLELDSVQPVKKPVVEAVNVCVHLSEP